MGDYLNIGNAGFTTITKGLYVDKTDMISYINHTLGTTDKLTCVSRPRRFGKSFAAKMLCAYYDKSCDSEALFREMKENTTLQEEYIHLLRGLFKSSGQTDKMIEAAYMTGILPIKKYGNQSAMSDFREYTMIAPRKLARYVGFTEDEVKALCRQNQMNFTEMQHWYDGYTFSRLHSVYSPNSVMEAIKNEEFGSYWTRTETYESLKIYIELNEDGLKEAVIQMIGGASIGIDTGSFQNDMTNIKSRDDVLTLLVHLGYLAYDSTAKAVFIPNEEVRQEFLLAVRNGKYKKYAAASD